MANQDLIPATVFCTHHRIEVSFLRSLHSYGLIALTCTDEDDFLAPDEVAMVERLMRLHYDLQINFEGLDVIQNLLHQQEELQAQVARLRNQLSFYEVRGVDH